MAIQIKDAGNAAGKWAKRAQAASPEYAAGVKAPRQDWAASTAAAKDAYQQGVQESISRGGFEKGVRSAGSQKWQEKSAGIGASRFAGGVTQAQGDYQAAVTPYLQALGSVSLPAKAARGSAQNLERVRAVADALHSKRVQSA